MPDNFTQVLTEIAGKMRSKDTSILCAGTAALVLHSRDRIAELLGELEIEKDSHSDTAEWLRRETDQRCMIAGMLSCAETELATQRERNRQMLAGKVADDQNHARPLALISERQRKEMSNHRTLDKSLLVALGLSESSAEVVVSEIEHQRKINSVLLLACEASLARFEERYADGPSVIIDQLRHAIGFAKD